MRAESRGSRRNKTVKTFKERKQWFYTSFILGVHKSLAMWLLAVPGAQAEKPCLILWQWMSRSKTPGWGGSEQHSAPKGDSRGLLSLGSVGATGGCSPPPWVRPTEPQTGLNSPVPESAERKNLIGRVMGRRGTASLLETGWAERTSHALSLPGLYGLCVPQAK